MGNYKKTATVATPHQVAFRYDDARHAYTLNDKPLMGTTTLIHEVLPPNLTWWASGMALKGLGWQNSKYATKEERIDAVTAWMEQNRDVITDPIKFEEHLQLCYRAHDEVKKEAGGEGTRIHEAIEIAIKEAITNNAGYLYESEYGDEAVERFAQWGRGKVFIYSEAQVYSEKLWIAGTLDVVYQDEGKFYIGDIKTSKAIYPAHFIQEGLYDLQQSENGFYNAEGECIGKPLEIAGYTIVNIPRVNANLDVKTYRDTKALKDLGATLVQTYKTLKVLKDIC